jgi:hypothetical protein
MVGVAEGTRVSDAEATGVSAGANGVAVHLCEAGIAAVREAGSPVEGPQLLKRKLTSRSSARSLFRQSVYISAAIHQIHLPSLINAEGRDTRTGFEEQSILPGAIWVTQQAPHTATTVVSI